MNSLLRFALALALAAIPAHAIPDEMTISAAGNGVVEIGSFGDRVGRANVILARDGKFTIGLVGNSDTRFSGTWRRSDRDVVYLRLYGAGGRDARGTGEVALRGRPGGYDLDRITITGDDSKGRQVTARFSGARYVPPPPAPVRYVLDSDRPGLGRLQVSGRENYRVVRLRVQLYSDGRAIVNADGSRPLRYTGTWVSGGTGAATLTVQGGLNGERMKGLVRHRYGRLYGIEMSGTRYGKYHSLEFVPAR